MERREGGWWFCVYGDKGKVLWENVVTIHPVPTKEDDLALAKAQKEMEVFIKGLRREMERG